MIGVVTLLLSSMDGVMAFGAIGVVVVVVGDDLGDDRGAGVGIAMDDGTLGTVIGCKVGFSLGYSVGASDVVEGGVMMSMGVGAVLTTGASVVDGMIGAGVVGVVIGVSVGDATGKIGAGVGIVQVGEEQLPNITNDTVVFVPKACVQT